MERIELWLYRIAVLIGDALLGEPETTETRRDP